MATANKKQIKPLVSIIPIESKDVEKFWPLAEFMVAEALAFSGKWADSSYFYDELKANTVFGICIGQIQEQPNYKQYEIIICTGKRRELWEDNIVNEITNFAKLNDCKKLNIMARPGWEKVSKKWGWKKKHVQLEKWI